MTEPKSLDEKIQTVDRDERRSLKEKMALIVVSVLLFVATGVIGVLAWQLAIALDTEQATTANERSQKQEIAQEAQAVICTAADVEVYDEALCSRLEAVADEPTPAAVGPKGDKGEPGRDGRDGKDSTVPGPKGDKGDDSTIPGPTGFAGLTGLTGPAGVDGKDGAPGLDGAPGKDGPPGTPGSDGVPGTDGRDVVSVTCEGTDGTSYWLVTYSDGTTQTSSGPCRLTTAPPTTEAP